MRSRRPPSHPAAPSRLARWEYVFFPSKGGPHAHLSLEELKEDGWVVQSSSANEKGQTMLLLRRPNPAAHGGQALPE